MKKLIVCSLIALSVFQASASFAEASTAPTRSATKVAVNDLIKSYESAIKIAEKNLSSEKNEVNRMQSSELNHFNRARIGNLIRSCSLTEKGEGYARGSLGKTKSTEIEDENISTAVMTLEFFSKYEGECGLLALDYKTTSDDALSLSEWITGYSQKYVRQLRANIEELEIISSQL